MVQFLALRRFGSSTPDFLLVAILLAIYVASAPGAQATGRGILQTLGGNSISDTPAGEQQNVNNLLQAINTNPSNTSLSGNLLPTQAQSIPAGLGLGALPLPIIGSISGVGPTDPTVKAIIAGLQDPMKLMYASYDDPPEFKNYTSSLTGQYAIADFSQVMVTNINVALGTGSPAHVYDTQVYTVAFTDPSSIGFIFRGTGVQSTYGPIDYISDGDGVPAPYTYAGCPGGCLVHGGFLAAFNAVLGSGDPATDIYAAMVATYQRAHGPNVTLGGVTKVLSAGHSLGGALATLGAIWAGETFDQATISMINAAAPRVGNPAFVDFFDGRIPAGSKYRLLNNQDVIPSLPLTVQGYEQTCLTDGTIWFVRDSASTIVQARTGDRPLYYTGSVSDHSSTVYLAAIAYVLSH